MASRHSPIRVEAFGRRVEPAAFSRQSKPPHFRGSPMSAIERASTAAVSPVPPRKANGNRYPLHIAFTPVWRPFMSRHDEHIATKPVSPVCAVEGFLDSSQMRVTDALLVGSRLSGSALRSCRSSTKPLLGSARRRVASVVQTQIINPALASQTRVLRVELRAPGTLTLPRFSLARRMLRIVSGGPTT